MTLPIVLVHGGGLDSRCWEPLQEQLAGPSLAADVGDCPVVDVDAGHMCMVSRPAELAGILNGIAAA